MEPIYGREWSLARCGETGARRRNPEGSEGTLKQERRLPVKSVVVGTAGHIDHGKSALVRALTGIDPDRLEEEKRRGITIDLGFAHLELPSNGDLLRLGFVDVPGHERFVRNMLAGVGGIDLVLLVVAADESIKPQTIEHFDICRLLQVPRGLTVITKSDLVDFETLDVVRLELEEFLRGSFLDPSHSPIVPVSAKTGAGLQQLKRELARVAAEAPARDSRALFRLPIDRVFVMKGFGTVVTGTLVSGSVRKEDELEVFPTGRRVRVRGVQVHGATAEQAVAGQRTALNLAGASAEDITRGMTLASPGLLRTTRRAHAAVTVLPGARPLKERARVHFHSYTTETIAEVVPLNAKQIESGQKAYAQLRFPEPLLLLPGDRFILRQFSPVVTMGGGVVLDNSPMPRSAGDQLASFLGAIETREPAGMLLARVARRGAAGLSLAEAVAEAGWPLRELEGTAAALLGRGELVRLGDLLLATDAFRRVCKEMIAAVSTFQNTNPLVAGIGKEELRERLRLAPDVFCGGLDALVRDGKLELAGEQVKQPGRGVVLRDDEAESKRVIEQAFAAAGLKVPALNDVLAGVKVDRARAQKIVTLLLRERVLVKLADDLIFHRDALDSLRTRLAHYKAQSPRIDVARFKELTGVTRKYAIPLLEYLDRERVTRRMGDERIIL